MRRTTAALAEGAAFHLAFTAAALGALQAWAHYCETRRHRA
jgi:hypothetical protein